MSELDATLSGASANSYLTIAQADDQMDGYDQVDAWEKLAKSNPDRQAALLRIGSRLIDQYCRGGEPAVQGQRLIFPRKTDKDKTGAYVIPDEVKNALLEYVDYRLENQLVGLKKLQAEGVKSASILGQNSSFDADDSQLPAGSRKELDALMGSTNAPLVVNPPVCDPNPLPW